MTYPLLKTWSCSLDLKSVVVKSIHGVFEYTVAATIGKNNLPDCSHRISQTATGDEEFEGRHKSVMSGVGAAFGQRNWDGLKLE